MQTFPPWMQDATIQATKHAAKPIEYRQQAYKAWNILPRLVRDTLLSVTPLVCDGLGLVQQGWRVVRRGTSCYSQEFLLS
jgi:hypothetical protein